LERSQHGAEDLVVVGERLAGGGPLLLRILVRAWHGLPSHQMESVVQVSQRAIRGDE